MALQERQRILYTDAGDFYREDEADRNSLGDPTGVTLVLAAVALKHYTTPAFEARKSAAGRVNVDNLMTADELHMDYETDVRTGDWYYETSGPSEGSWFRVAGSKYRRIRSNVCSVLILPTDAPVVLS
jgi:hypothetical protein